MTWVKILGKSEEQTQSKNVLASTHEKKKLQKYIFTKLFLFLVNYNNYIG